MRIRCWPPRLVAGAVLSLLMLSGCGAGKSDAASNLPLTTGSCVDASNANNITVVDCASSKATARVIGTYEKGRCPAGSFAIKTTQTLNGHQVPSAGFSYDCIKALSDITAKDLANIDAVVNPKFHGLPLIGAVSQNQTGATETGGCLTKPGPVSGSAEAFADRVDCGSSSAKLTVVAVVAGDNGVYTGDDCPTEATAAVDISQSNPPKVLCVRAL